MAVVAAAMSPRGSGQVANVIALETVLGEIERATGRPNWPRRDPERYWLAVFGDPGAGRAAPWMWRIGGRQVAIHMTVADGEVVGSTPSFLGANPAVVPPDRPRARERTLTGEEMLARELLASLAPEARATAIVDPVAPPEILTSNSQRADARPVPQGVRFDDVDDVAQAGLERLIRYYLDRAAARVAAADWERAVADGLPDTTFAWAGGHRAWAGPLLRRARPAPS